MIIVNNLSGQLGNRLIRLNNALQQSKKKNMNVKLMGSDSLTKDIDKYFIFDMGKYPKTRGRNIHIQKLGDLFFGDMFYDPKSLIRINPKYKKTLSKENNRTNIGIHIRYHPIDNNLAFTRNENILEEYYIDSIKWCLKEFKNVHFIIFGAISSNQFPWDKGEYAKAFITKYKFYNNLIKYLKDNKISFSYSITINDNSKGFMEDFLQMCDCDVLISSHSTFCICAGYLGKTKKIIHSRKFMDTFLKRKDKFWVDLYNGGSEYYKLCKLV